MNSSVPERLAKQLRTINLIGAGVIVAALACTSLGGIVPLYARVADNNQKAEDLRAELAKLDGLSRTITQVQGELDKTQERLEKAESRLPTRQAMDQFMGQLAKVADDVGLQVDAVTPREIRDGGSYKVMPVEIRGTGSFETCYQFLVGLRQMNRLTRLDDLVLEVANAAPAKDGGDKPPVCRVSVGISTFIAR